MLKVISFKASWCGPCKMLSPIVEQIKSEFTNVEFVDVNVDEQKQIADDYGIMSVPTVVFEVDNNKVFEFSGFRPKDFIENEIKKYI